MKEHLRNSTEAKVTQHLELLEAAIAIKHGEKYKGIFIKAREDLHNGRYATAVVEKGIRMAKQLVRDIELRTFNAGSVD